MCCCSNTLETTPLHEEAQILTSALIAVLKAEVKGAQTHSREPSCSKGGTVLPTLAHKIAIRYCFHFLMGSCPQNTRVTGRKDKIQMGQQSHEFEQPQETTSDGKDRAGRGAA